MQAYVFYILQKEAFSLIKATWWHFQEDSASHQEAWWFHFAIWENRFSLNYRLLLLIPTYINSLVNHCFGYFKKFVLTKFCFKQIKWNQFIQNDVICMFVVKEILFHSTFLMRNGNLFFFFEKSSSEIGIKQIDVNQGVVRSYIMKQTLSYFSLHTYFLQLPLISLFFTFATMIFFTRTWLKCGKFFHPVTWVCRTQIFTQ